MLNINELAHAVKPILLPGEDMQVKIMQEGKEVNQGVGYLDRRYDDRRGERQGADGPERGGDGDAGVADGGRADDLRAPKGPATASSVSPVRTNRYRIAS